MFSSSEAESAAPKTDTFSSPLKMGSVAPTSQSSFTPNGFPESNETDEHQNSMDLPNGQPEIAPPHSDAYPGDVDMAEEVKAEEEKEKPEPAKSMEEQPKQPSEAATPEKKEAEIAPPKSAKKEEPTPSKAQNQTPKKADTPSA